MQSEKLKMQRILIVNVNWRGDVLFSTPFIRAIRKKYPDAFIGCLVASRCVAILKNNPHLNEVLVLDEDGEHRGLFGKLRLIKLLRSKHFDSAFLLHRSFTRTLICYLAAIHQRIGYYTRKRSILLTKSVPQPIKEVHKVEYFLNIARFYAIEADDKDYEFVLSGEDKNYVSQLLIKNDLSDCKFLVAINPGGNWDLKRWPQENFAVLADRLIADYSAAVIITGAKNDLGLARNIAALMKNAPLILCGETSLGQLAALMARADLVISGDSGPMHIAISQGTRVIALFGPTSPRITGPYGKGEYTIIQKNDECEVPCHKLDCQNNRCMKAIDVKEVLKEIKR